MELIIEIQEPDRPFKISWPMRDKVILTREETLDISL